MNILDGKIKPFFHTNVFFVLFAKISADMSYFNTKKSSRSEICYTEH